MVAVPDDSATLTQKPVTGHDQEPVPTTPHLTAYNTKIDLNVNFRSWKKVPVHA
jgi:hypothetical protein